MIASAASARRLGSAIPAEEIVFHPHSFGDPAARLFSWRGQLYRAISAQERTFFEELFHAGIVQCLVDRKLFVESEVTDLALDGYGLVVKHRHVPFPSYPVEWCSAMLRDAALTMVDVLLELANVGLTLKDGHPWNVVFDGPRAVYVDLGSIAPARGSEWEKYDEFCRYCYYPLLVISYARDPIGRCLLAEDDGVLASDLVLLPRAERGRARPPRSSSVEQVRRRLWPRPGDRRRWLERLRRDLEAIAPASSVATGSAEGTSPAPSPEREPAATASVSEVLNRLRPASVMVLGTLVACIASLAARQATVVAASEDPAIVTQLYDLARSAALPLLPVVMDFTKPTPSRGVASHWLVSASRRLRCEMVIALGVVEPAARMRHLNVDQIAEALSNLTARWLVVESARGDAFAAALRRHFRSVTALPSEPREPDLFVCEQPISRPSDV